MSKVLIVHYGRLFYNGCADGTGLRAADLARRLTKKKHKVTIAETDHEENFKLSGINIIGFDKKSMGKSLREHDLVILTPSPEFYSFAGLLKDKPIVVDLYDPILINDLLQTNKQKFSDHILHVSKALSEGDYFICANEEQKHYYTGMLNILGKLNPGNANKNLISVVPPGIPQERLPEYSKENYKGKLFSKKKKVILWPGLLYNWYDPVTPLKAMKIIKKKIPEAVLVFVGANHYRYKENTERNFKRAKALAKKLGLLNKQVFFTRWLPYEKRHIMYLEADLAVITCRQTLESEFSFRSRILDCIWGEVPVICTSGNKLSQVLKENGLGKSVESSNHKALAESVINLLNNKKELVMLKSNTKEYKDRLKEDKEIILLSHFCGKPAKTCKSLAVSSLEFVQKQQDVLEEQCFELDILKNKLAFVRRRFKEETQELKSQSEKRLEEKDKEISSKNKEINDKSLELNRIYNSKGYKLILSNIWAVQNIIKKKEPGTYHPFTMILALNNKCNLDCSFCDIKSKNKEMSYDNLKKVIDSGQYLGAKVLVLTGGEPFMHPNIFDIINYAKSKGFVINITTNGTLVKPKIDLIKKARIDSISISIDGLKKAHDKLRRKNGTFNLALESLKLLKKETPSTRLLVYFVVTNQNVKDLNKVYELSKEIGVEFNFWPVNNNPSFYLTKEDEIKTYVSFIRYLCKTDSRVRKWEDYYLKAVDYHKSKNLRVRCLGLRDFFGVDWDGNMIPCCLWGNKKLVIGNILRKDIGKIFNSRKAEMLRQNITHKGCTNCYNHAIAEFQEKTGLPFILSVS